MAELTPADEDAALGQALIAGDAEGIARLYDKYKHPIHEFAARIVDDRPRAEDIAQTRFVQAIERRATLRDPSRVRTWLYSIAHNLARDELTKNREARHAQLAETVPAPELEPEMVAVRHSDEELVSAVFGSLEPDQRVLLELSVRHGLSAREIAAATGTSSARAALRTNRSRAAFRSAALALLVARSRTHCPGLAAMVPPGIRQLSPWLRRSIDHHMRRCDVCRARGAVLSSPVELLGGIAFLPLPASLAHAWAKPVRPMPRAQLTAARPRLAGVWRSPAVVASGLATLLLFGGGLGGALVLHNRQHPATAINPHRHVLPPTSSFDPASTPSDTSIPPTPTPSPSPTDTPSPSAAQTWADGQALMRSAGGYHVTYASYYVYPAGGVAGNPTKFDLQVQPSGDFQGTYIAIDGFIGQFDIRRLGGVLAVRHINAGGNFGIAGAPPDALQFFNITSDKANSLGDNWFPLTASAQQPAAHVLAAALADYVSARTAANILLVPPPGAMQVEPGLDAGSTQVSDGKHALTFRTSPNPFVDLSVPDFDVRFDSFGG
jgi:RNA polymerase sigma factor (sigma-70 family)